MALNSLRITSALAFVALAGAQNFEKGPTRSPHGQLSMPCSSCHTSTSWKPIRSIPEFDHNRETRFALRGMHQDVQCAQCHTRLVFSDAGTRCADCHADIHRRQFGARCEQCHSVQGWRVATQSIRGHQNRFPLLGAHAALNCDSCHREGAQARYTGLSTACASCHLKDYQTARPLDHRAAGFPLTCEQCHGMDNWRALTFDHNRFTKFPLQGAHARVDCAVCHTGGRFAGTPADCFACHAAQFNSTTEPNHVKAGLPHDCSFCHSVESWSGARFDHNGMTKFALTGAHARVDCAACHIGGRFAGTPSACFGCHATDYQKATNPNHVASRFSTDCASCHTTAGWQGAKFDHNLSRFPLTGAHVRVTCAQCHVGGKFTGTPVQCAGCHLADFQKTSKPNHAAAGFPQDCAVCHTTVQWLGAKFDHNAATKFALTGAHASLQCALCHVNNRFAGTPAQCAGCHMADYNGAKNPNHASAGFPQDCSLCHTTAQWLGAKFDHSRTRFPLTGAHVNAQCAQCHVNGQFAGTPAQCGSCHMNDYKNTTNPNHAAAGFPQDCSVCHTTVQWLGAKFDHNTATKFQLTGAHMTVQCSQCHKNNVFAGTPAQCAGCHISDFNGTKDPPHAAAGFPQDCTLCHNTAAWQPAHFDHNAATKFPLTGAHVIVRCSQCHKNNVFAGTPTQCASCHLSDFQGTKSPNHVAAGFPQDCTLCHNTAAWQPASFDHSRTKFPLTGAHMTVQCAQCHTNNVFAGTPAQCASCHITDYNKTTNPNHAAAGFPQDCSICHSTASWAGATFDHSRTRFPLTGAHAAVQCSVCHASGQFASLSTSCVSCHLTNYNKTTNPNHASAGFPQQCEVCHNTSAWKPASFSHGTTGFPLTGAHTTVQCSSCHIGGRFAGTPTACYDCHSQEYNTVTNPNHMAAGFPHDCSVCHTTAAWSGAVFNHTWFPIYSGSHAGKWTTCNDCHTNPSNYAVFSCTNCHAHAQSLMDPKHRGVRSYVYNSANCYQCHPTGQGGD